jgi:hypothetical protein
VVIVASVLVAQCAAVLVVVRVCSDVEVDGGGARQLWQRLVLTPEAAKARFPNVTVRVAVWLLPGAAWSATLVLNAADIGPTGYLVAALGIVFVVGCFAALEVAVIRWCVLDRRRGLVFRPFRTRTPFSPPIPVCLANFVCSRRGVWGPASARDAFGSPLVVSLLPQHMRWAWVVGPLVSLVVVVVSAAQPLTNLSYLRVMSISVICCECPALHAHSTR